MNNNLFGLEASSDDEQYDYDSNEQESEESDRSSIISKQSTAFTEISGFPDNQSVVTEATVQDNDQPVHEGRKSLLRQLVEAQGLSDVDKIRLSCKIRSRFPPVAVESIITKCAEKKGRKYRSQRKIAIAIAGMAKLYVGDLVMKARKIQGNTDMISPDSLRRAAREWRDENRDFFP